MHFKKSKQKSSPLSCPVNLMTSLSDIIIMLPLMFHSGATLWSSWSEHLEFGFTSQTSSTARRSKRACGHIDLILFGWNTCKLWGIYVFRREMTGSEWMCRWETSRHEAGMLWFVFQWCSEAWRVKVYRPSVWSCPPHHQAWKFFLKQRSMKCQRMNQQLFS